MKPWCVPDGDFRGVLRVGGVLWVWYAGGDCCVVGEFVDFD